MTPIKYPKPAQYPLMYDLADCFLQSVGSLHNNHIYTSPATNQSMMSCGVTMLSGLGETSPSAVVDKVLRERAITDYKRIREAFVLFSDIAEGDRERMCGGSALYRFIKSDESRFGAITEFGPLMNPNTGNIIKMWVWTPKHKSLHPEDRMMPIHGKKLVDSPLGKIYVGSEDPRFSDSRVREA